MNESFKTDPSLLLVNRFSWFGADALGVERQRTGLKLGSGSEPALELLWWKRGKRPKASGVVLFFVVSIL